MVGTTNFLGQRYELLRYSLMSSTGRTSAQPSGENTTAANCNDHCLPQVVPSASLNKLKFPTKHVTCRPCFGKAKVLMRIGEMINVGFGDSC